MPDRLPSLIVLAGFWVPPAIAGWVAARARQRGTIDREGLTYGIAALFAVAYAAAWFYWNVKRMPPYIPGATMDPTFASPQAVRGLAIFSSALILPGSALAFVLAYRRRRKLT